MDQASKPIIPSLKVFTLIWFGQFVSQIGSGLTGFALGVWVYQQTGSVTQFALVVLFNLLPTILLSPVAGVLADRWDRRRLIIFRDTGAALSTLSIAVLAGTGHLALWHIYILNAALSVCNTFQGPAFNSATSLLIPKEAYGRASGMLQFSRSATGILVPLLAGFLVIWIKLHGVILIDFATYLFSTTILLLVRFPQPPVSEAGLAARGSFWREAAYGWTYLGSRPGLMGLAWLLVVVQFLMAPSVFYYPPSS